MNLNWVKCQGDVWCKLDTVNLDHPHFNSMEGVYIIWHGGISPHTVRVGQGTIRDRLRSHRTDPEVQQYSSLGLYVTWASVEKSQRDGVETFLYTRLSPKVGQRTPVALQINVNMPW